MSGGWLSCTQTKGRLVLSPRSETQSSLMLALDNQLKITMKCVHKHFIHHQVHGPFSNHLHLSPRRCFWWIVQPWCLCVTCTIYEGDLLLKQSSECKMDKFVTQRAKKQTNSPAMEDTAMAMIINILVDSIFFLNQYNNYWRTKESRIKKPS